MSMNASAQSMVGLMTNASLRFVVPVYQRPYSWDEEQCEQLWDDIRSVGSRPEDRHFTGSVVWVQDGVMSASGVTPRLLIDGQQRVTTLALLLIALADYAKSHPEEDLNFTYEQLINGGYLVSGYMKGEDRYRLTLSQGDRGTFRSILDNLVDPDVKVVEESSRILNNLAFFKQRLVAIESPNVIWDGIQRLEVVSISLDAGKDNPQLIFESMNSTGKDLSSADLIRNFVLMGLPREQQDSLYLNHWRVIEETLGADSYDEVFDEFIRNYLTVLYAPESLAKRDVYRVFKRHVFENGYDKDDRMKELLEEMECFARYYAAITSGAETQPQLKAGFDNLSRLGWSVLNPLLMSFYQDYEADAFGLDDFVSMVRTVESYIFRRAVCDAPTNSLNKFLPSVIARLNKVQEEGGNYREAFESMLLLEAGTARRFPTNAEFGQALRTRDSYHFRKSFYLLTALENQNHPKDPIDFSSGVFTIEHIMPQNARSHEEWLETMGDVAEDEFESLLNNIGNLTLTAYNSELSDSSFEEKKKRCIGGFDSAYLVISGMLKDLDKWTPKEIDTRADKLVSIAEKRWPFLSVDGETAKQYESKKETLPKGLSKTAFKLVFDAGMVKAGEKLVPTSESHHVVATVADDGRIVLPNGEGYRSPSLAAKAAVALEGGAGARNGWHFWRVGESGPVLDELRRRYLIEREGSGKEGTREFRISFWGDFYEHCSNKAGFIETFSDPTTRPDNADAWASFGIGNKGCHISELLRVRSKRVASQLYYWDVDSYKRLLEKREAIEKDLELLGGRVKWDDAETPKRTRTLTVYRDVDFSEDDLTEVFDWMIEGMYVLRGVALGVG